MPTLRVILVRGPTDSAQGLILSSIIDGMSEYSDGNEEYIPMNLCYYKDSTYGCRFLGDWLKLIEDKVKHFVENPDEYNYSYDYLILGTDDTNPGIEELIKEKITNIIDISQVRFYIVNVKGDSFSPMSESEQAHYNKELDAFYL